MDAEEALVSYEEWLASLKVGDEVCYYSQWHGYIIETIEKITPTGQIKTKGSIYKSGRSKSGNWGYDNLEPITQKVIDNLRGRELLRDIKNFKFDLLNLEQLEKLHEVIKRFEE